MADMNQIGGAHYKKMGQQPVDLFAATGCSFFEGSVIKYVCRYKDKNGKEDLKKALHYVNMIKNYEYENLGFFGKLWKRFKGWRNKRRRSLSAKIFFFKNYPMELDQELIIEFVLWHQDPSDLNAAAVLIEDLYYKGIE